MSKHFTPSAVSTYLRFAANKQLPYSILVPLRQARSAAEALRVGLPPDQPLREAAAFTQEGEVNGHFLIVAHNGLYSYDSGRVERLLAGYGFGLDQYRDRWYAFRHWRRKHTGEIISFRLSDGDISDIRIELTRVGPMVHQVRAFEDSLYVTDTLNNRLVQYRLHSDGLREVRCFLPGGWLSSTDVWMNSITEHEGKFYVMYHNQTQKSGRKSQIVVLDHRLQLLDTIQTIAGSAHNIAFPRGELTYCDSDNGVVVCGDRRLTVGDYPRGLVVEDGFLLVGLSEIVPRERRAKTNGKVVALDLESGHVVGKLTILGSGSIRELARIR